MIDEVNLNNLNKAIETIKNYCKNKMDNGKNCKDAMLHLNYQKEKENDNDFKRIQHT